MSQADARQRGFTLIEMSIVLVIIGLIIGGILKGQELIESARIKNVINQIDVIRAATNAFQDRFNGLPGDYAQATTNITTGITNGNGDGVIGTAPGPSTAALMAAADKAKGENQDFFNHLLAANLLGGGAVLAASGTAVPNFAGGASPSPNPSAAYPQSGISIVYGTHLGGTTNPATLLTNWLVISKFTTTLAQTTSTTVVSPQRAFQLDAKYDDGNALGGSIRALAADTNCADAALGAYVGTRTTVACDLAFTLN